MLSLSTDIIEAFNSTSRYLDDLLNIDNSYSELQLNKAYSSNTEAPFKIYDKWDDFNFEIVNFKFLDEDVPHFPS